MSKQQLTLGERLFLEQEQTKARSPEFQTELFKESGRKQERALRKFSQQTERLTERRQQISTGATLFKMAWPILGGLLLFFLIIGPGSIAVLKIIQSTNIWIWIGFIFIAILIWRNR
jgi:hypothetical protein